MFPFKTKSFAYTSELSQETILKRLYDNLARDYFEDGFWVGKIKGNGFIIERRIDNLWNNFRPVIVAETRGTAPGKTNIKGYYRVHIASIIAILLMPIITLCIAIKELNAGFIIPAIIIAVFMGAMGYLFFSAEYKRTKEAFEILIDPANP